MIPNMLTTEAWHLSYAHIRHLCGSPEKVKLAPLESVSKKEDREKIFAVLRESGTATRADLVSATRLSLQRVIDLTREAEHRGTLIRLVDPGKPILLRLAPVCMPPKATEILP